MTPNTDALRDALERWPGYERQSWRERFHKLDQQYQKLLDEAADMAKDHAALLVASTPTLSKNETVAAPSDPLAEELRASAREDALAEARRIAIHHSNYGHIEGNRRAFAIAHDIEKRIPCYAALTTSQSGEGL